MSKISIGILGSCVSRDNFNTIFNPHYKELYSCDVLQHQTSLIALMGTKVNYKVELIDKEDKNDFDKTYLRTQITEEFFVKLKEIEPDFIIIDFFSDVYYGVRYIEGCYITNNMNKIYKTNLYGVIEKGRVIKGHTNEYFNLWKSAVNNFLRFLEKELPNTKVILVKAKLINDYSDNTKKINEDVALITSINDAWDKMNNYVISKINPLIIDMNKKNYQINQNHHWGLFYVHYELKFYHDFLQELGKNIILDYKEKNTPNNK